MPFALNEATRFISPTKTPEFLAAGVPVVSTPIVDVVRTYGAAGLVEIAATPEEMVAAVERLVAQPREPWLAAVDCHLAQGSWDSTWTEMTRLMRAAKAQTRDRRDRKHRRQPAGDVGPGAAPRLPSYDWLIVGAGFAGSVMAERLASVRGERVLVVDRRSHIGGNAFDTLNEDGLLIHRYGPHIFHTNADKVVDYLSNFTAWRPYEHRVLAAVDDQLLPVPINLDTVNRLYGLSLTSDELAAWLATRAEPVAEIRTSEDVVVSTVGRELYEKFFQGYTRKQWGLDPSELDKSVTARVPTPDQPRRPLLHRYVPGHAGAGLHADVRAHARPPQHHGHARHGLCRHPGLRSRPSARSSPDRSTSTSATGSVGCPIAR